MILRCSEDFGVFRCVIEATSTYRWLYKLLSPDGSEFLAHPFQLRALVQRRSKTDRLDTMLLAQLLRETTRQRCRLQQAQAKQGLRWQLRDTI